MNEKSWSRIFSRTGLALSAFLISSAIAMTAIYTGFTVIGHGYFSADMQLIVNAICMYLIGFPVAWMIFQTVPHPDPIRKTEKWEVGSWIGLYLICTGVAVIGNMISTLLAFFIGPAAGANVVETVILQSNPLLNFILTVIAAPVVEELLTRKLLIDKILLYGEKTAILVSALLFGLMHGNFYQFFYAFGIGLILAYAYVRTGKISGTIAIHMAINFMGSEVILLIGNLEVMPGIAGIMGIGLMALYASIQMGAAISGIILLCCFWRKKRLYQTPYEWSAPHITFSRRIRTVAGNPGIILFILLCLLRFVLNV